MCVCVLTMKTKTLLLAPISGASNLLPTIMSMQGQAGWVWPTAMPWNKKNCDFRKGASCSDTKRNAFRIALSRMIYCVVSNLYANSKMYSYWLFVCYFVLISVII